MKLASIAEVQPILFKDTEYGLDNPTDNHECELYDTYQYVATKHNYQDSAYKEKHVSCLLKVLPTPFAAFRLSLLLSRQLHHRKSTSYSLK